MGLTDAQRAGLHSSASAEWYTPPDLLVEIAAFLGPDYYDPCPPHTPGTALQNALWAPWRAPLFVNPPYGRGIGQWVHRALTETGLEETLLLVPARTDARWFRECFTHAVLFFHGRLHFSGAAWNAPFPSALVYRGGASRCLRRGIRPPGHDHELGARASTGALGAAGVVERVSGARERRA